MYTRGITDKPFGLANNMVLQGWGCRASRRLRTSTKGAYAFSAPSSLVDPFEGIRHEFPVRQAKQRQESSPRVIQGEVDEEIFADQLKSATNRDTRLRLAVGRLMVAGRRQVRITQSHGRICHLAVAKL
jgi:hypothetical protein